MLSNMMSGGDSLFGRAPSPLTSQAVRRHRVSSALDRLDDPYLPLLVQGTAGVPLNPSFAEQKKILKR
jgi:hypothetical protein